MTETEPDRILADHQWIIEQLNQGALAAYEGQFIAVFNKQIVAHDSKQLQARRKAARKTSGVPAERFAVKFVEKLD